MKPPHDFKFQFGPHRILRGRGWRGLLTLGFLLAAGVLATAGGLQATASLRQAVVAFHNS